MLTWSNLAKFQKMLRDAHRPEVPRELGPTVTVKEAAALLNRNVSWVRARIADGRLNAWQDPYTHRYHIILDDVNRMTPAPAVDTQHATRNTEPADDEDEVKPFSHDTYGAAGVLEDAERESERRYQARLAQLDAELAALRADLGITEDDEPTEPAALAQSKIENPKSKIPSVPPQPATLPAPAKSKIQNPKSKIESPFPVGWVRAREAAAMLDIGPDYLTYYVRQGKLQRRKVDGRGPWLYDSVEVEQLATAILAARPAPAPNENVRWWGSRSEKWQIGDFDYWMTAKEAAEMLGVRVARISALCRRGLLQCYQKEPGKRGSRLLIPNTRVVSLRDRLEHTERRARWRESRTRPAAPVEWEEEGIGPLDLRAESAATRRDRGDLYTTRQVALLLGISPQSVHRLRQTGRLTGVRSDHGCKLRGGLRYWFFRKEEVHALQEDPRYRQRHAIGKRAQQTCRAG